MILNITGTHIEGTVEPDRSDSDQLKNLFDAPCLTRTKDVMERVDAIACLIDGYRPDEVIFDKVPYFWMPLQKAVTRKGIMPPVF